MWEPFLNVLALIAVALCTWAAGAQLQPGNNTINTPASNPVLPSAPGGQLQTLTGIISDSFCGRHHYMLSNSTPSECTRYCIAHRGKYVLLVGDKIYTLENQPGAVLMKLAGQEARITGHILKGDIIEVKSVTGTHNSK